MQNSKITFENMDIFISSYKNGTIHIRKQKDLEFEKSMVVLKYADLNCNSREENDESITLTFDEIKVVFCKKTKNLSFYKNNKKILSEKSAYLKERTVLGENFYKIKQSYQIADDEALYGLGQLHDGVVNYRGKKIRLAQDYLISVNPFLISTGGYGIMWDNYSESFFEDNENEMSFKSTTAFGIDYYVFTGETFDEIISSYRELTGIAPMFPRWVYGFQQCKCSYRSFAELQHIVKEYRKRNVPLDCIVQDCDYWNSQKIYSPLSFIIEGYENPKEEIQKIHDLNAKLLISLWPVLGNETEAYKELNSKGLMLPFEGSRVPHTKVYDAYSEEANRIYFDYAKKGLLDMGVDSLWMDGVEPEYGHKQYTKHFIANERCSAGVIEKILNTFSLSMIDSFYNKYRETNPEKRMYILTRSSFLGQQRDGAVTWSGDVAGEWGAYKDQIANAINFSLSGIPYWSHDIGGWSYDTYLFPEYEQDKSFRELYTRWFAFGVFTPIFRSHGVKAPREIWQFGEKGSTFYDAQEKLINLRYSLMDYIYSTSYAVTQKGYSMIRGLAMDFSADKNVLNNNYEYMFGKNLLVRPVTEDMYHINPLYAQLDDSELFITEDNFDESKLNKIFETEDFQSQVVIDSSQFEDVTKQFELKGAITPKEDGEYYLLVDNAVFAQLYLDDKLVVNSQPNPYHFGQHFQKITLEKDKVYEMKMSYTPMNNNGVKIKWKTPTMYKDQMTEKAPTESSTYLPANSNWYDYYTNEFFEGGQNISKIIPIDEIGLYVKAGSIMPITEAMQYTTEKPNPQIDIVIYSGADATFTLYEDENDNYNYEKGMYSTIEFSWNEQKHELTLGDRFGSFEGMVKNREFNIYLINQTQKISNKTKYNGEKIIIPF